MSWYSSKIIYGYEISLPTGYSINEFISFTEGLNSVLEYKIYSLSNQLNISEFNILDNNVIFVIGIMIQSIGALGDALNCALNKSDNLSKYIIYNSLLEGFEISLIPDLYSGIEWVDEEF